MAFMLFACRSFEVCYAVVEAHGMVDYIIGLNALPVGW